jgi:hypothetical protein
MQRAFLLGVNPYSLVSWERVSVEEWSAVVELWGPISGVVGW